MDLSGGLEEILLEKKLKQISNIKGELVGITTNILSLYPKVFL